MSVALYTPSKQKRWRVHQSRDPRLPMQLPEEDNYAIYQKNPLRKANHPHKPYGLRVFQLHVPLYQLQYVKRLIIMDTKGSAWQVYIPLQNKHENSIVLGPFICLSTLSKSNVKPTILQPTHQPVTKLHIYAKIHYIKLHTI